MVSTFNARDAAVYERSMGRWSRRLAAGFIAFAAIGDAKAVLDVGCGPGSLLFTLAEDSGIRRLVGIDASDPHAAAARAKTSDRRITIHDGDACVMPFKDGEFDAALRQLVLQFVPDPLSAVREMRRVVRSGGVVAAAAWNSYGGMPHQRMFWDIAVMVDHNAAALRAATFNRRTTVKGALPALFAEAGLGEASESSVTIWMDFAEFEDFWSPIQAREGTLVKYVSALGADIAGRLKEHCRAAYLSARADGLRQFACMAHVCRGIAVAL